MYFVTNMCRRSETSEEIPLIDKRVEVLREAGSVLEENFGVCIKYSYIKWISRVSVYRAVF